jgi:hypothetical protein
MGLVMLQIRYKFVPSSFRAFRRWHSVLALVHSVVPNTSSVTSSVQNVTMPEALLPGRTRPS